MELLNSTSNSFIQNLTKGLYTNLTSNKLKNLDLISKIVKKQKIIKFLNVLKAYQPFK